MTVRRISVQVRLELRSVSYVIQMRDLLAIDKLFNLLLNLLFQYFFWSVIHTVCLKKPDRYN